MLRECQTFHVKSFQFLNKWFYDTIEVVKKKLIENYNSSYLSTSLPPNSHKTTSIQFSTNKAESYEIAFMAVKYR